MTGWFQRADYSSVEFEGADCATVLKNWNSIDIATEDRLLRRLDDAGDDHCPWGFSVTNDAGIQIMITRQSIEQDTCFVEFIGDEEYDELGDFSSGLIPEILRKFMEN